VRALAALLCLIALATPACFSRSESAAPAPTNPSPSPLPAHLPPGIPFSFGEDVASDNVPAAALIPLQARVTGTWTASTPAGDTIVVAWELPGEDPFRSDRGVAAWRRFDDGGAPWRPIWGAAFPARRNPVLGISTQLADLTGDGSADALVTAETGGSGACTDVRGVDLATGTEVYRSQGCDRRVEPSSDPTGLVLTESVFARGDPHCCPSSVRTTHLVYADGAWDEAGVEESPT
jgi:hypothetical protein